MIHDIDIVVHNASGQRVAFREIVVAGVVAQPNPADIGVGKLRGLALPDGPVATGIIVRADGYREYGQDITLPDQHNTLIYVGATGAHINLPPLQSIITALPAVHVSGRDFVADGKVWKYVGISAFALTRRWLEGGAGAVAPYFDQYQRLGAPQGLVLRVFRFASHVWNYFGIDPVKYPRAQRVAAVVALVDYAASRGCYVHLTGGDYQPESGVNDDPNSVSGLEMGEAWNWPGMPDPAEQQREMDEYTTALAGKPVLIQTCNEPRKNGCDVRLVQPRGWPTWDSGDYDEDYVRGIGTFINYHGMRGRGGRPWDRWLQDIPGASFINEAHPPPLVLDEPTRDEDYGYDKNIAAIIGADGVLWVAGACFHSADGRDGRLLRPETEACFQAFLKGATAWKY